MTLLAKVREWLRSKEHYTDPKLPQMDLRDPNQKPPPKCVNPPYQVKSLRD